MPEHGEHGGHGEPGTAAERVAAAFGAVDRADFLPEGQRRFATLDEPLPIGHGQTNSQPTTVRALLEVLDVVPGQRVLDVGCGSGWTTALLGHLVGPHGTVVGVEIVPDLVAQGRDNLVRATSERTMPWVRIEQAEPGVLGLPGEGPFDRILCSAEASAVPGGLVAQLGDDGVLVLPVRGRLLEVRRAGGSATPRVVQHGRYAFVPLVEPAADHPGR